MIWTFDQDKVGSQTQDSFQPIRFGMLLLLAIVFIRLATLGFYPLYDPSESRYAEMGRKMLETGNWVTPFIDYGVPFWGKPPLTLWLTAFSLWLGGINEFSARLPSTLLGIGIVWVVFHVAKVQRNTGQAVTAALILASSLAFFVMSGAVVMDQCLTFGTTLALAAFWLALREQQSYWAYLFFIGLSIGILAKGPLALVLVGFTIGVWVLITGRWADIWRCIPWVKGTFLMLCISVPWYLIAEQRTPGFLEYFIIGEHWKRFTVSGWNQDGYGVGHAKAKGTIWLYWLLGGFPWSFVFLTKFIPAVVRKQTSSLVSVQTDQGWQLYCLLWMLSSLVFFSFSANIIWTYIVPAIPGLALLLSDWFDAAKKYRTILALIVPLVFLGGIIYLNVPGVDFFRTQRQLVTRYQQQAAVDEKLIYFGNVPFSAQFYLEGKGIVLSGIDLLEQQLPPTGHDFYILNQDEWARLPESLKTRFSKVSQYRKFILVHAVPST